MPIYDSAPIFLCNKPKITDKLIQYEKSFDLTINVESHRYFVRYFPPKSKKVERVAM